MKSVLHILSFVVLALCVAGCSDKPPAPDVEFLASDFYVSIGGHHLVIPAVAMNRPEREHVFDAAGQRLKQNLKETLKAEARDPEKPMPMDRLRLHIAQYNTTGEHLDSLKICALLSRKWSQALCTGQQGGLLSSLPRLFDLADADKLASLYSWINNQGRQRKQIEDLDPSIGQAEIICGKPPEVCMAIVEVMPRLAAVWAVWGDENTGSTAEQVARMRGAAIVQFVRRALGPVEDTSLANAY